MMLTNPTLHFKNSDYGLRWQINSDASDFFPQLSAEVLQIFYFLAPFFFLFNELSSIAGLLYTLAFPPWPLTYICTVHTET